MKKLLVISLLLLVGCQSVSKTKLKTLSDIPFEKRYIIAVMDFENKTGNHEYDALLNGLNDVMIEELLKYRRFTIVERENLPDIMSELAYEMTGFVNAKHVKELGNHLGSDALLFGTLKSVVHREKKNHGGLAYTLKRTTEVTLSTRLVSVETCEILSSSKMTSSIIQRKNVALGFAKSGNITDEQTAIWSALDIAIKQLANDLADRTPTRK